MQSEQTHKRPIRSYVVRGGRLTPSQQEAIDSLWPIYGIEAVEGYINRKSHFGREAELVTEIGFGMGDSLVAMAQQHPERDYIGIDVHPPGIGTILREIQIHKLKNLRIMRGDAMELLETCFENSSLDRIQIFFPDPWHKKRHRKRRMIQATFVTALEKKLLPGGILHLATDWKEYAIQMMDVMSTSDGFKNLAGKRKYSTKHERVETKFERRGRRLGHDVWDLVFEKIAKSK